MSGMSAIYIYICGDSHTRDRVKGSVFSDDRQQHAKVYERQQMAGTHMATRFVTPYESDSCRHFIFGGVRVACCGAPLLVLAFVLCCCCVRRSWFFVVCSENSLDCAHSS